MATLVACANGNLTSSSTWAVAAAVSNSESANTAITTSFVLGTAFTPGAITIDGIGIKIATNTAQATAGTITVALDQAGTVAGTSVSIDTQDIPGATTAGNSELGWYFFKFGSPVTLGAGSYSVKIQRSSSTNAVNVFSTATTDWSRFLRTTTTAAPTTGDDMIICREWTASGTGTDRAVTMDSTANTDYGSASTSAVTPALALSKGGTLKLGVASSTAYLLKISGNIVVYNGGTLNFLQSADSFPGTSSFVLTMDCVANVDFGIILRNGYTFYFTGTTKANTQVRLTADVTSGSNKQITIASTTGWSANDVVGLAPTNSSPSNNDTTTVVSVDNSTQATLSALTFAHSGTSPTQGEVINLTRNMKMVGVSATAATYIVTGSTGGTLSMAYVETQFLGSSTALKRGVDIVQTTGSVSISNCSFRDGNSGGIGINVTSASGSIVNLSNNVFYNTTQAIVTGATTGVHTIDSNWAVRCLSANRSFQFGDNGSIYTNNVAAGNSSGEGFNISETGTPLGSFSGNISHTNTTAGFVFGAVRGGTASNCKSWRNTINGITRISNSVTFDGWEIFGNGTTSITEGNATFGACGDNITSSLTSNGDTTFGTPSGIYINGNSYQSGTFVNCDFSQVTGIKVAHTVGDLSVNAATFGVAAIVKYTMDNCRFGSNMVSTGAQVQWSDDSYVKFQRINRTAGNHAYYDNVSVQTPDAVIYSTASPSLRIQPVSASRPIESGNNAFLDGSSSMFQVAVNSGSTVTVSVKVRESVVGDGAAYNGQRCKLYVAMNNGAGIASDTLLATATSASSGAWETLSGTTATVADDCILEFFVTCGYTGWTTGWVNVDDWTG